MAAKSIPIRIHSINKHDKNLIHRFMETACIYHSMCTDSPKAGNGIKLYFMIKLFVVPVDVNIPLITQSPTQPEISLSYPWGWDFPFHRTNPCKILLLHPFNCLLLNLL